MKISIVSDLHCRGKKFPPSFDPDSLSPADVLVIAGDLATRTTFEKMLAKLKNATGDRFGDIILLRGNHDYYVTDQGWIKVHGSPEGPSLKDNFVKSIGDIDFICTPMWSPISRHRLVVSLSMNDYNYIPGFDIDGCNDIFWNNLKWLDEKFRESRESGRRQVVVTHHIPLPDLIDEAYEGDEINEAFCVMDENALKTVRSITPELWIHGHCHRFMDKTIGYTRYVRNPYGYEWDSHSYLDGEHRLSKENTGYVNNFTVEL